MNYRVLFATGHSIYYQTYEDAKTAAERYIALNKDDTIMQGYMFYCAVEKRNSADEEWVTCLKCSEFTNYELVEAYEK